MAGGHLIARQVVEITAASRAEAAAFAARTSAAAPSLSAALERLLDAHDRPGERIRLDRLEIDLGACDADNWEAALVAGLERGLAARLAAAIADMAGAAPGEAGLSALSLLSEFARSGRVPWWGGRADTPSAAVRALARTGIETARIRRLLALPGAIERLVFQLGDADLAALAELAQGAGAETRPTSGDAGRESIGRKAGSAGSAGRTAHWVAVLRQAAEGGLAAGDAALPSAAPARPGSARSPEPPLPEPPSRPSRAIGVASPEEPHARPQAAPAGPAAPGPGGGIDPVAYLGGIAGRHPDLEMFAREAMRLVRTLDDPARTALRRAIADASGEDLEALRAVIATLAGLGAVEQGQADHWRGAVDRSRAPLPTAAALPRTKAAAKPLAAPESEAHDAIAVDDGGLPLVWPFLPRFFSYSGLMADGVFLSEPARHRAATLLFHLATGERVADETRLMLPKLLAGIDLDAVHDPGEPLDDDAVAAAEGLLSALIEHAPMLGRISVGGLRSAYLQRPGSLATRDGHWLLRVERKTYDVLLDRLPWSFQWVKLPWMAAPLQVEW